MALVILDLFLYSYWTSDFLKFILRSWSHRSITLFAIVIWFHSKAVKYTLTNIDFLFIITCIHSIIISTFWKLFLYQGQRNIFLHICAWEYIAHFFVDLLRSFNINGWYNMWILFCFIFDTCYWIYNLWRLLHIVSMISLGLIISIIILNLKWILLRYHLL